MKKILVLIAFVGASFSAIAYPTDFPPTAFQLAQIHQFATEQDKVEKLVHKVRDRSQGEEELEYRPWLGQFPSAWQLGVDAEKTIRRLIDKPLVASEGVWREAIKSLLAPMLARPDTDLLGMSFREAGCEDVILKAILLEVEAMKEGKIVAWRGCGDTGEVLKTKTTVKKQIYNEENCKFTYKEVIKNYSFSLGLFSGFIYDGYRHHNFLDDIVSACTYTYFSAHLYEKRIQSAGYQGFWDNMHQKLPAFFEAHKAKYNNTYDTHFKLMDIIYEAERWYGDKFCEGCKNSGKWRDTDQNNQCSECASLFRKLYNERNQLEGFSNKLRFTKEFHLFGVKMDPALLEQRRIESRGDQNEFASNTEDQRGDFLKPHHAVYGAGEFFHPKMPFPDGQIVEIYGYKGDIKN